MNIVLFLVDDLGWRDIGANGSTYYQTPNIDRLAREGVRFTDAYAACAVCSPTRAAVLTGKYPARLLLTDWLPNGRWEPKSRLRSARFVRSLRDLGCRVALDDFGAGYTSFRNLKALAVDCVKIDGSYVRGLEDNVDNQLFVRTLLGLAEGLGLVTVAECVETAPEAALLTRRGVRFLQGWHFGKPEIDRPWLAAPAASPIHAASQPVAAVAGQSPASRLTVLKGGLAGG